MTPGQRFRDVVASLPLIHHFTDSAGARAKKIAKENTPEMVAQRKALFERFGGYLRALTMTDHSDIAKALLRSSLGDEPAFENGFETRMTFQEMRQHKDLPKQFEKEAVLKRAKEFAEKNEALLRAGGAKAKETRDYFMQKELIAIDDYRRLLKKDGYWADVLQEGREIYDPRGKEDIKKILEFRI
jgi:hypothetical protein